MTALAQAADRLAELCELSRREGEKRRGDGLGWAGLGWVEQRKQRRKEMGFGLYSSKSFSFFLIYSLSCIYTCIFIHTMYIPSIYLY